MKTKTKIKYFNPNKVEKNSRKWVNIWWKQFFKLEDIRLAMCECNIYFYEINNNLKSK